ncbi:Variant-specific surface protein, partial [Giardia duodenalis]
VLLAIYLAVGALAIECKTSSNCENNQCDTVGGTEICMQCTAGNVPINGVCTAHTNSAEISAAGCKESESIDVSGTSTKCGQCTSANYFLYKGGCYLAGSGTGGKLCTSATDGVCKTPADGYFVPPGATKTDQSVISCSEGTEITVNSKKYKALLTAKCAQLQSLIQKTLPSPLYVQPVRKDTSGPVVLHATIKQTAPRA